MVENIRTDSSYYYFMKRLFDLALISIAFLLFFSVWMSIVLLCSFFIWFEDQGRVLYSQLRMGKNGVPFLIWKFRTMRLSQKGSGSVWTVPDDARVTRFGRMLRMTALDELPQLLNIIKGDMSFVGPRPFVIEESALCQEKIPGFNDRLQVLPGLTSLAEIYDEFDDPRKMIFFDRQYIAQATLGVDIKLILLSIRKTISGQWDKRRGKVFHECHE